MASDNEFLETWEPAEPGGATGSGWRDFWQSTLATVPGFIAAFRQTGTEQNPTRAQQNQTALVWVVGGVAALVLLVLLARVWRK
jgi:hypothetical protein